MSGIFGLIHKRGGPVGIDSLDAMRQAMDRWGRDGHGTWRGVSCGLGHVLAVDTPESRCEKQPYACAARPELVLTADVRLDNRSELLEVLEIPGEEREGLSDDVIIWRAFARWGEGCVEHFAGAFAFALWDEHRRRLFCARDHLGCRPFYFHDGPEYFVFATDLRAILAVPGVPRRPDELAVAAAQISVYGYLREHTCFRDIASLLPAHRLQLRDGLAVKQAYWFPDEQPLLRLPSTDDYAECLRDHLREAVTAQLRTIHPIGSHVSGGLDSSGITVLAARQLRAAGRALRSAYSWSPPVASEPLRDSDERCLIDLVCRQENLACAYVNLTPEAVIAGYSRDVALEPTETLLHEALVCPIAAAQGVRVMLSGWGGDEFASFGGAGYFAAQFWRGHWPSLLRETVQRSPGETIRRAGGVFREIIVTALPGPVQSWLGLGRPAWARPIVMEAATAYSAVRPEEWRLLREEWCRTRLRAGIRRNLRARLTLGHLERRMTDWANEGAGYGINYRFPLLDRRLVEFCFRLPPEMFLQQGWKRFLFRCAVTDLLPSTICWNRTKNEPTKFAVQQRAVQAGLQRILDGTTSAPEERKRFIRLRLQFLATLPR